ncbi:MAG: hypothetical protein INR73_07770 [Williamsia sp.]|nr:hypothetical protein [Williamsia sp.]
MNNQPSTDTRLAQSASAIGAGILGFGIASKLGLSIGNYAFIIVVVGGILHVWGMYLAQMKNAGVTSTGIAKILWISAWLCLFALIMLVVYWLL